MNKCFVIMFLSGFLLLNCKNQPTNDGSAHRMDGGDSVTCELIWVHDSYYAKDSLQRLAGFGNRKITFYLDIKNTSLVPLFLPLAEYDSIKYKSSMVLYTDDSHVGFWMYVTESDGAFDDGVLKPGGCLKAKAIIGGYTKSAEGETSIGNIVSKLKLEYRADDSDCNAGYEIAPITFDKTKAKYRPRPDDSDPNDNICM